MSEHKSHGGLMIWTAGVVLAMVAAAQGGYVASTDALPSPRYESGEIDSNYTYDGLDRRIRTEDISLLPTTPPIAPPDPGQWVESFFDISYHVEIELEPGVVSVWDGQSQMQLLIGAAPMVPGEEPRLFYMEILSLEVFDPAQPWIAIREDPAAASLGTTTLDDVDPDWWVESFFDVCTQLTMDGGGTWAPAWEPIHMTGMPEPGAVALLALGGLALIRRRRK